MLSMRQDMKHYKVEIELTGFSKKFDYIEEAHEYAEMLAKDTGFEVLVVEINPRASNIFEMYVPICLYDGASGEFKSFVD